MSERTKPRTLHEDVWEAIEGWKEEDFDAAKREIKEFLASRGGRLFSASLNERVRAHYRQGKKANLLSDPRAAEAALRGQGKVQLIEELDSDGTLGCASFLDPKKMMKERKDDDGRHDP